MKIPPLIRPGNGVARQYKNSKRIRNLTATAGGISTTFGILEAMRQRPQRAFLNWTASFCSFKVTQVFDNAMTKLQPEYNKILKRAKNIHFKH